MTVCANCGHDAARDAPIERDGIYVSPFHDPVAGKVPVRLTTCERLILHALAQVDRPMSRQALSAVFGSQGTGNGIQVQIYRIRKAFRLAGVPCPVQTCPSHGYRWANL